jgi:hypothetical protein
MKSNNKKRRVINIDKIYFDRIKEYCDTHSLKMSKWMAQLAYSYVELHEKYPEEKNFGDNSALPPIEDVVKQYIGHPEKFEKYINNLHKKLGIIKESK